MQRAQRNILADGVHDCVVDDHGLGELFAAVQHAMAHRADFIHGFDHAVFRIGQGGEHVLARFHMGGHVHFDHIFFVAAGILLRQLAAGNADALHQALGQHAFVLHINQLIFEGRGTRVYNQNFHGIAPPFSYVLTIWHYTALFRF